MSASATLKLQSKGNMNTKASQAFTTFHLLTVHVLPVCLLIGCLLIGLISLSAAAVATRHPAKTENRRALHSAKTKRPLPEFIGEATMSENGAITLFLCTEWESPVLGLMTATGQFVYQVGDKDYRDVLEHLGGMKPGEHRPVRPWPDIE